MAGGSKCAFCSGPGVSEPSRVDVHTSSQPNVNMPSVFHSTTIRSPNSLVPLNFNVTHRLEVAGPSAKQISVKPNTLPRRVTHAGVVTLALSWAVQGKRLKAETLMALGWTRVWRDLISLVRRSNPRAIPNPILEAVVVESGGSRTRERVRSLYGG